MLFDLIYVTEHTNYVIYLARRLIFLHEVSPPDQHNYTSINCSANRTGQL